MQSQMIGLQSSVDRILSAIQAQAGIPPEAYPPQAAPHHPHYVPNVQPGLMGSPTASSRGTLDMYQTPESHVHAARVSPHKSFPPLPGFAAPVCLLCRSLLE